MSRNSPPFFDRSRARPFEYLNVKFGEPTEAARHLARVEIQCQGQREACVALQDRVRVLEVDVLRYQTKASQARVEADQVRIAANVQLNQAAEEMQRLKATLSDMTTANAQMAHDLAKLRAAHDELLEHDVKRLMQSDNERIAELEAEKRKNDAEREDLRAQFASCAEALATMSQTADALDAMVDIERNKLEESEKRNKMARVLNEPRSRQPPQRFKVSRKK